MLGSQQYLWVYVCMIKTDCFFKVHVRICCKCWNIKIVWHHYFTFEVTWVTLVTNCYLFLSIAARRSSTVKYWTFLVSSLESINQFQPTYSIYGWKGEKSVNFMAPTPPPPRGGGLRGRAKTIEINEIFNKNVFFTSRYQTVILMAWLQ